jgi:hypothetical protein
MPGTLDVGPPPMPDANPFQDDKPMADPNTPPPGRETYYKPYWKKNGATAAAPAQPTPATMPVKLDPYAVAPPVHIKAKPVQPVTKVAIRAVEPVREYSTVKVAATEEIAPVSLSISDDPPAPPMILPAATKTAKRIELGVPVNPLR